MKLLILDDDKDLLDMISRRLLRKEVDCVCANNIKEAKILYKSTSDIDGIVCDFYLENGENGLTFYEENIRGSFQGKFILATGDETADTRIQTYKKMDSNFDVLEKPFSVEALLERIEGNK